MEAADLADSYRWARRVALLLTCNPADADDLVQEAFVRAIIHAESIHPEALRAWLRRTMTRLYLRSGWRTRRERQLLTRFLPNDVGSPSVESSEAMVSALATLTPRQRACIVLRYFDELTESEIAGILRLAEGTVKAHLAQAREKLRKNLQRATIPRT